MAIDPRSRTFRRLTPALLALIVVACGGGTGKNASPAAATLMPSPGPSVAAVLSPGASAATSGATSAATPAASETPGASSSQEPDSAGLRAAGDIPDNAVFLTYHDTGRGFSIHYVEGWQVTAGPAGIAIRDKDSSETVAIVPATSDVAAYITGTDLPALQTQTGFQLVKRDTVKVGAKTYDHLLVQVPAPPDPVTGKQIPSTIDRYYVPGPKGLAIVSLSTPDGVDNVDAFRQMIESFTWS